MNKNIANTVKNEILSELEAFAKSKGYDISFAGGKFDDTSLTMKLKIVTNQEEAEAKKSDQIETLCKQFNLVTERGGRKLVDYWPRNYKMPFIYEQHGRRYKCDLTMAKMYFAA